MDVENRAFVGASIIFLALRADQVAHRLHISSIAGERQTPELPATFDSSKQRVVVIVHIRCPCRVMNLRYECRGLQSPLSNTAIIQQHLRCHNRLHDNSP